MGLIVAAGLNLNLALHPLDVGARDILEPAAPTAVIYEEDFPFVTASGTQLMLDGQPFQFTGFNIFNANSRNNSCWGDLGEGPGLDQGLNAIGPGQTVFRAWFFQSLATTDGQRDWSAFDHTLTVARQHGERVIATLGNDWNDCEGDPNAPRYKTEKWYRSGYRMTLPPALPATYRQWVAEVVTRYRDNPTIMAWQLMNEASTPSDNGTGNCTATSADTLRNFAQDMGALVKSIDRNHLLSLGTVGGGECGTRGADYQLVYSVPEIDLCEMHDYGPPAEAIPQNPSNGLEARLMQCGALNKPLFMGETGIQTSTTFSQAQRAAALEVRLSAELQAGVVGTLIWDWTNAGASQCCGYEVGAGDPALGLIASSG